MKRKTHILALLSCSSLPGAAAAQIGPVEGAGKTSASSLAASDGVQDIIVTVQKRTERLRYVPLSINVASGEQLKTEGITNSAYVGSSVTWRTNTKAFLLSTFRHLPRTKV